MSAAPRLCTVGGLPVQAVLLHRSLAEVRPDARLTVLATAPREERAMRELGLEVMPVAELEERRPELARVRGARSKADYARTLKPALLVEVLEHEPDGALVTHVDADIAFHADPAPAWEELDGASIGVSDHRHAPRFRRRERWAGRFNAGWVSFRRDANGLEAAHWWRERVLEWCHDRVEGDRYSDQGYLRDWPERFEGVHVFEHPGVNVAPWSDNSGLSEHDGRALIDGRPVLFFHAQSLRLRRPGRGVRPLPGLSAAGFTIDRGYRPSALERELLWEPYVRGLATAMRDLHAVDPALADTLQPLRMRERLSGLGKRAWMRLQDVRRG